MLSILIFISVLRSCFRSMSPTEPSKLVSVHQKIFLRRFNGGGPSSLSCLGSSFIPQTRAPIETGSEVLECLTSLNTSFWGEYDNTLCLDKMHKIYELIVDDRIGRDTTDSSYSTSKASPNVENLVSLGEFILIVLQFERVRIKSCSICEIVFLL